MGGGFGCTVSRPAPKRNLIVVGAGVIGMEYACMINVIPGTTVTVVDPRPDVLPFADGDVIESLQYAMRQQGELCRACCWCQGFTPYMLQGMIGEIFLRGWLMCNPARYLFFVFSPSHKTARTYTPQADSGFGKTETNT